MALAVIYEDFHLIAVCKPAPLLTQAPPGIPSLEAEVKAYLKEKYAKPGGVYLGIPHRLDRPVSGVMVFARNSKAAARVALEFREHRTVKTYWALADGMPAEPEGTWRDFLRKLPEESRSEVVAEGEPGAKEAITHYRTLNSSAVGTLLELRPATGRTHQLRLQAASRGLPILGDTLYGSTRSFGPIVSEARERIIALHARQLEVKHPFRDEILTLTAEVCEPWPTLD